MRALLLASIILAFSLAFSAPHGAEAAGRATPDRGVLKGAIAARIDSAMTAAAELGVVGTLLVERDGEVILHRAYGTLDRVRHTKAQIHTPYIIGSLSKQFTATAVYKLESQGKLRLEDSLGSWFSEVPPDKRGITVEQLIHHTSGLPYLGRGDLYDSVSVDSMLRETFGYPLDFRPGTNYGYSSPGYDLLARIVERASGRRFNDYVREELFRPAGMNETGFIDEPASWPASKRTPSYSDAGNEPDPPLYPATLAPKTVGSGSVVSTAGDLWKWELALRDGRVLDAEATRRLFTPGPIRTPGGGGYAGGWNVVKSQRSTNVILHAGDLGGFNSDMRRLIDEHATIIFLSNGREGGRGYREVVPIMVTRIIFGPEPDVPRAHARPKPSDLATWNGTVALDGGVAVESRVRDGAVWLTASDQEGMFRISGADSMARSRALSLNGLAASVADSLLRGGDHSLDSTFSPSLVESGRPEFFRLWRAVADTLGAPARTEVLGSLSSSPIMGRTLIRVQGSRGHRILDMDWLDGHLIRSTPVEANGLSLRFVPESPSRLSRYDLWTARTIRVGRG